MVGAAHVRTSMMRYFDSRNTEIKVEQDDKCFMLRSPPRPAASLALAATGVALPPCARSTKPDRDAVHLQM